MRHLYLSLHWVAVCHHYHPVGEKEMICDKTQVFVLVSVYQADIRLGVHSCWWAILYTRWDYRYWVCTNSFNFHSEQMTLISKARSCWRKNWERNSTYWAYWKRDQPCDILDLLYIIFVYYILGLHSTMAYLELTNLYFSNNCVKKC